MIRAMLALASLLSASATEAGKSSNSFLTVEGEGVSIADDGGICVEAGASGPVRVTARPGWLVNGRESIAFESARGLSRGLNLTSKLGEDHTCFPPPPTVKDEHETTFVLGASATPASQVEMYALPATSAAVSVSASPAIVEKGRHKVTKTWEAWTCRVCGARQEARTEVTHYDVEPEAYAWTATAAGEALASSTWSGLMSKGLGQTVSFSVMGTRSACASCTYTASTNALVDVHELSVSRDDYLGINRTDAGRADPVVKTATALIDPAPTGSAAYSWTDRGICSFTGRTDQATARYFAPDPDRASASLLAEPLTVEATVSKGGQTASATCTTNFTVVKVGVVANGVGEAKEETEGAFIPYVADAANGQWTEEGTNALVAVSITCEPELPASESVSITAPEGALYARFNGAYYAMPRDFDFPVRSLDDVEFFLHGHDESSTMTDKVVTVTHQPSGAKDVAKYTSVKLRATNIKFNHDTSSSDHDAINIRRCYADPAGKINVSNGEWLEVGGVVTNEPFCYTTNRAVTVKARFEASNFITSARSTGGVFWRVRVACGPVADECRVLWRCVAVCGVRDGAQHACLHRP